MLNNNKITLVLIRNTKLVQESVGRLPHHHSAEKLSAKPSTTPGSDSSFNDGDLEVWARLAEHVGGAETTGASADNNDIGLGIII
jgi:hypothetical protein